mmetsp:Transcript_42210/g.63744  ORF Transcript_42210/g.63744 Transcript_42210/m.63744 type:complete len:81 (-) Transcript_42210:147-389(-)
MYVSTALSDLVQPSMAHKIYRRNPRRQAKGIEARVSFILYKVPNLQHNKDCKRIFANKSRYRCSSNMDTKLLWVERHAGE